MTARDRATERPDAAETILPAMPIGATPMPKTVRALVLAAVFVLGGTATAHAAAGPGSGSAGTTVAAARAVAAVQAGPCMAC